MLRKNRKYLRINTLAKCYRALIEKPNALGVVLLKKHLKTATEAELYGDRFIKKWLALHSQIKS